MPPVNIGVMGFGRVGRNLFRILYQRDDIRLAAINDTADHEGLEYLLRFDTILGRFPDAVSIKAGNLYAAGRQIPMSSAKEPGEICWRDLGVDIVVEATGRPWPRALMERHLEQGAKRVILCVPPEDPPDITVVMGVNDHMLKPEHRIISNASCTAHCVAPALKILHEAFGVERAFFNSVHAYTNQDRLADVPAEEKRRGRAAAENIIPQETNAGRVLDDLLPDLRGRISALSMNVPVPNGSVVDLVCWHTKPVSVTAINEVMRTAASTSKWRGILDFEDNPIVSSDVVHSTTSSTFDSLATMVLEDKVSKTLSWYDNGWGYTHRAVDLIRVLAAMKGEVA